MNYLAFHLAEDKKAPPKPSDRTPEPREWWEAFWKPVPPRPIDQDEATLHLFHAEALRHSAPLGHLDAWENGQSAALVVAAGGWQGPGGLFDARLRLSLIRPMLPGPGARYDTLPVPDQLALALQQQFTLRRDDTSPALPYLAIRAARRALAVNPDDAQAYLVLGESYLRLLHSTRERTWSERLPKLVQLRRAQASAALNQAVFLKPDFAQAHHSLYQLYGEMSSQEMGYLDLALQHLRAYLKLFHEAGAPPGISIQQFRDQEAQYQEELSQLAKEVEKRDNLFEVASAGWKVSDRAFKAWQMGLAGKARDLLLESDIAAFGPKGMAMELELLIRTGRAKDVWKWTGELSPDDKAALGESYHWLRTQALAASGDYALAEEECSQLSRSAGSNPGGQASMRFREIMAMLVSRRVLNEQSGGGTLPDLILLTNDRFQFRNHLETLAQSLRWEAEVAVLRGLLSLEEGDIDEAEIAFRVALSYWKDADSAASGGGLDFSGRAAAEGYLELLK
jgi:tetratricopeptide (TPR) repeat protein